MVLSQALAKDLPWKLKDSRVLEILQAVGFLNSLLVIVFSFAIESTANLRLVSQPESLISTWVMT